jgi:hypothetical protein
LAGYIHVSATEPYLPLSGLGILIDVLKKSFFSGPADALLDLQLVELHDCHTPDMCFNFGRDI